MTAALVIIPARLAATRLPRKPLADIGGKPMIVRVLDQARNADIGPVTVACDNQDVADAVRDHGGNAVMTDPDHASGSDRIQEAAERVDPEEAFVASVASCHMLTFLALCAKYKHSVLRYRDEAVGVLEKNSAGKLAITRVTLNPQIEFAGEAPDASAIEKLHHSAHEHCFIANSVNCEVVVA